MEICELRGKGQRSSEFVFIRVTNRNVGINFAILMYPSVQHFFNEKIANFKSWKKKKTKIKIFLIILKNCTWTEIENNRDEGQVYQNVTFQ